ncbi:MAG TPA: hypothetical protein VKD91_10555 [Pyrinomonadaceae bacterium]|nr:hypothetical protein [Pyrinomonadaceae bacterium]
MKTLNVVSTIEHKHEGPPRFVGIGDYLLDALITWTCTSETVQGPKDRH